MKLGIGLGPVGKRLRVSDAEDGTGTGTGMRTGWQSTEVHEPSSIKAEGTFHRHTALGTEGEGEGYDEDEEGDYIVDQSAALVQDNNSSSSQSIGCAFEEEEVEEEEEEEEQDGEEE